MPLLEIPSVIVDDVAIRVSPVPALLLNCDPAPDQSQVPVDTLIRLQIYAIDGDLDTSKLDISVDGVPAVIDGVLQPAFSAAGGQVILDPTLTLVTLAPHLLFDSDAFVHVQVYVESVGYGLDNGYTFHISDVTAPRVEEARAVSLTRVRVRFSETVRQLNATDTSDALHPAAYAFTPLTRPAITPYVTTVTSIGPDEVELEAHTELSPGQTYRVTVSGVIDAHDNPVMAPFVSADFVAARPAVPAGRRLDLWQQIPAWMRAEDTSGELRLFVSIFQELIDLFAYDIDRWREILDPDLAPEPFVDGFLKFLGNPFPFALSIEMRRQLAQALVPLYRRKGTGPGIQAAVRFFLGIDVGIVPLGSEGLLLGEAMLGVDWVLGPSDQRARYTFDIVVPRVLTDDELNDLLWIADYMKTGFEHIGTVRQPTAPSTLGHVILGVSRLGENWLLH